MRLRVALFAKPGQAVTVQVFPSRVEIWNAGALPEGVTVDGLVRGQISILRNPDIAHALYLQGYMEKLGRDGVLIDHACKAYGLPAPKWRSDARGVTLIFRTPEVTPEVTKLIRLIDGDASRQELQQLSGLKDGEHVRKACLQPALAAGMVEMTLPSKPTSRLQRYRLTPQGKRLRKQSK